jgi:hypothetical protein
LSWHFLSGIRAQCYYRRIVTLKATEEIIYIKIHRYLYRDLSNKGQSVIQMVIFPDKFVRFLNSRAELDCFIQKKNIFITFYV